MVGLVSLMLAAGIHLVNGTVRSWNWRCHTCKVGVWEFIPAPSFRLLTEISPFAWLLVCLDITIQTVEEAENEGRAYGRNYLHLGWNFWLNWMFLSFASCLACVTPPTNLLIANPPVIEITETFPHRWEGVWHYSQGRMTYPKGRGNFRGDIWIYASVLGQRPSSFFRVSVQQKNIWTVFLQNFVGESVGP